MNGSDYTASSPVRQWGPGAFPFLHRRGPCDKIKKIRRRPPRRCLDRLLDMQEEIEAKGTVRGTIRRYLIAAQK